MNAYQKKLVVAARDTLMNIGGVCGVPARDLAPGLSLGDDLHMTEVEFSVLAKYQRGVGNRLRGDGRSTSIFAHDLSSLDVAGAYALTVERSIGEDIGQEQITEILDLARRQLQEGTP
jgi:hypothetical protein